MEGRRGGVGEAIKTAAAAFTVAAAFAASG